MSDPTRLSWLRDKFIEGTVNVVVTGLLFLAGFGALEAYMADARREKLRDDLVKVMTDERNATVKREADLLERITSLEHGRNVPAEPALVGPTFMPAPSPVPTAPISTPALVSPTRSHLDWVDKHSRTYSQFDQANTPK